MSSRSGGVHGVSGRPGHGRGERLKPWDASQALLLGGPSNHLVTVFLNQKFVSSLELPEVELV